MSSDKMTSAQETQEEPIKYCTNLQAKVETDINADPKALVHSREWKKIMIGDPVEINPSVGHGFKIMTVDEWSSRWKRNDDFADCLACGSNNTKEHHFNQTWCRGKKMWESELLCLDCHMWSWRSYRDPDFMMPEDYEKEKWNSMIAEQKAKELKEKEELP